MGHVRVREADEILGDRFRVLDEGYVRLVGYMGGDQRILDIASEHYGNDFISERERIMRCVVDKRNRDSLGMVELKFHFEMPIAEAMTFVYEPRANVNEFSLRYSDAQDVFHNLSVVDLLSCTSGNLILDGNKIDRLVENYRSLSRDAFERYSWARNPDVDIAKEIARAMLGSNLHTRFYWKINLADLLDFAVRTYQETPSKETIDYVKTVINIAERVAPLAVRTYLQSEDLVSLIEKKDPDEKIELQNEISDKAEVLLDNPIPVLGDGFVTLVDYLGNDFSVLNAARVSTGKDEKSRSDSENKGLINYLMRHRHTTPFEMVEFLWKLELPLFVYRQGGRHRTFERVICDAYGSSSNIKFYHPKLEDIAAQSRDNHQGRGEEVHEMIAREFLERLRKNEDQALILYQKLRHDLGASVQVAKRHLPVNRFLTWYFKTDLHNALHYLGLRLDSHAQLEIREPSKAMAQCVKAVAPWSYDAFERYKLNSLTLSSTEIDVLRGWFKGDNPESYMPAGWLSKDEKGNLKPHRERDEFFMKLDNIGWREGLNEMADSVMRLIKGK